MHLAADLFPRNSFRRTLRIRAGEWMDELPGGLVDPSRASSVWLQRTSLSSRDKAQPVCPNIRIDCHPIIQMCRT